MRFQCASHWIPQSNGNSFVICDSEFVLRTSTAALVKCIRATGGCFLCSRPKSSITSKTIMAWQSSYSKLIVGSQAFTQALFNVPLFRVDGVRKLSWWVIHRKPSLGLSWFRLGYSFDRLLTVQIEICGCALSVPVTTQNPTTSPPLHGEHACPWTNEVHIILGMSCYSSCVVWYSAFGIATGAEQSILAFNRGTDRRLRICIMVRLCV